MRVVGTDLDVFRSDRWRTQVKDSMNHLQSTLDKSSHSSALRYNKTHPLSSWAKSLTPLLLPPHLLYRSVFTNSWYFLLLFPSSSPFLTIPRLLFTPSFLPVMSPLRQAVCRRWERVKKWVFTGSQFTPNMKERHLFQLEDAAIAVYNKMSKLFLKK